MSGILISSDEHFDENIVAEGVHLRFAQFLEEQRVIQNANMFISLGDLLNKHQDPQRRTSFNITDALTEFFQSLHFEHIILLKGNHDESFYGKHNLSFMSLDSRIKIIDTPTLINVDSVKLFLIPFYEKHEMFFSALSNAPEDAIILMHQELLGFKLNSKKVSENGIVIERSFPLIISGHLHDFQNQSNKVYIGAPYQTRRDELPDKKIMIISNERVTTVDVPITISQRFIFLSSLENVEAYDVKGKTIVLNRDAKVTAEQIESLKQKGVNIVTAAVLKEEDVIPIVTTDLSSFSLDILRTVVNQSDDLFFKAIGSDLLQMLGV